MKTCTGVRVEAPVERVWALLRTAHWQDWMPRAKISDFSGPVDKVGTTYVQSMKLMGFEMKSTTVVVEVEPPRPSTSTATRARWRPSCPRARRRGDRSSSTPMGDAGQAAGLHQGPHGQGLVSGRRTRCSWTSRPSPRRSPAVSRGVWCASSARCHPRENHHSGAETPAVSVVAGGDSDGLDTEPRGEARLSGHAASLPCSATGPTTAATVALTTASVRSDKRGKGARAYPPSNPIAPPLLPVARPALGRASPRVGASSRRPAAKRR